MFPVGVAHWSLEWPIFLSPPNPVRVTYHTQMTVLCVTLVKHASNMTVPCVTVTHRSGNERKGFLE